jgi:hypothetical protein
MDGHREIDGRSRRTGPTSDASLDREIESVLAVEPSPEFVARVRARVAEEPEPGQWRVSWMFAAAGAVAVAIVAVLAWPSREPASPGDTRVQSPSGAKAIDMATPRASLTGPQPQRPRAATARVIAVAASPDRAIDIDLPEVVIAENEVRTFASLVASLRQSRFDAAVPAAPNPDTPLEIKELPPVEPLEIEPIVRVAALQPEGERP